VSIEDRDWYKEDFKRRANLPDPLRKRAVARQSTPTPPKRASQLGRLIRVILLSAVFYSAFRILGL
jgi:hypothetical protein